MIFIINLLSVFMWNLILKPTTKKGKLRFLIIVFIQLFCLITFRKYTVGFDSANYYKIYLGLAETEYLEVGYTLVNKLAYSIGGENYCVLWSITALLILIPVFYYIYHYSNNVFLSICTYICLGYYYNSMNQIRQVIAVSICLLAYIAILKKKYIRSATIIIVAMLFHRSAIIVFIFPVVMLLIKSFNRWMKIIPVILLIIFLNFDYIVATVIKHFHAYSNYFIEKKEHLTGGGSAYFFVYFLILCTTFMAIRKDKILIRMTSFKLQLFAIVMAEAIILLSVKMHIFNRFAQYFEIYTCTLLPNIYMVISKGKYRQLFYIGLFIFLLFIHHYYLFFAENHMGRAGILPYILFNK